MVVLDANPRYSWADWGQRLPELSEDEMSTIRGLAGASFSSKLRPRPGHTILDNVPCAWKRLASRVVNRFRDISRPDEIPARIAQHVRLNQLQFRLARGSPICRTPSPFSPHWKEVALFADRALARQPVIPV